MTSKVTYLGQLRTEAVHLKSQNKLITDAPIDNQGMGASFSPTDMVATALGACILTIMGIKARDKNLDIKGAYTEVKKTMASDPRRISRIDIDIYMPDHGFTEKEKKILSGAAHACPVAKSLSADLEEHIEIHW